MKAGYVFLLLGFFMKNASANDCDYTRVLLQNDIASCEQYKIDHPHLSFKTFMGRPYGGYVRHMCIGTFPGESAPSINRYGQLLPRECFIEPEKIKETFECAAQFSGSTIEVTNQTIGEKIPLVGTSFDLVYYSNRVKGRRDDYIANIPLTPAMIPTSFNGSDLTIQNEIGTILVSISVTVPTSNQSYSYEWNGVDANSVETWGKIKRKVIVTESSGFNPAPPRESIIYLGNLKAKKLGTGAWLPSIWHFYDIEAQILYKGDGSFRQVLGTTDGAFIRIADSNGKLVHYFDSTGKLSHTKTGLTGKEIYSFTYDAQGRILTITEPFNKVTTFSRYLSGGLKAIIAPNGAKASIALNSDGYLSKLINPNNETYLMTYSGAGGLLTTFMPPNGDITTINYDGLGNLVSTTHSNGFSATLSNILTGFKSTSAEGRMTSLSYNSDSGTEITKTPSGLQYFFTHDSNSDQRSTPTGTEFYYYQNDPRFGSQIKLPQAINIDNFGTRNTSYSREVTLFDSTNPYSINKLIDVESIYNSEITSTYDGVTRTKLTSTKLGRTTKVQIDEYERMILEQKGDLVAKDYSYTNELLTKITQGTRKIVMSYYANGLMKSIRNTLGQVTTFTYDSSQRLKTKTLADSRVISYNYDYNGNLTSITPPGKSEHILSYGINNLLSEYAPPLLSSVSANTTYSYNNDKQLTKITRPDGEEVNFIYNSTSGLQTSITGSFGTIMTEYAKDLPSGISDHSGNLIQQFYRGTVVNSSRYYMGTTPIYEYERTPTNGAGEKVASEIVRGLGAGSVSHTITYSYDHDEYLTKTGDQSLVYNVPNGQLTKSTLGRIKDYYYYNAFGEVRKYVAKYRSDVLYEYELQRDGIGRVIKKTETLNGLTSVFDYVYDEAGRLTQVSTNGVVSSTYGYDSNSNRTGGNIRGEMVSATYDEQDRLTNYNGTALTYNANGELLTKGNRNYVYDVFGNLREYSKGAVTVAYEIDPLQRRSGRVVNGSLTTRYVYNPEGKIIGQLDASNRLIKTFVYASKSHVPDYYIDQNNNKFKIITDHLGSVRLVVSKSGRVLQMMEHDEFGRVLQDTRPGFLPFGFAGGVYESRTGLVRFGVRDFDPETGRWLSKDPIKFAANDTNLYGYVMQDPINFIDPSGLVAWGQVGGGVLQFGLGSGLVGLGISTGTAIAAGSGSLAAPVGYVVGGSIVAVGGNLIINGLQDIISGFNDQPSSTNANASVNKCK